MFSYSIVLCHYEIKAYTVVQKELLALKRKLRRNNIAIEKVKKLLRILTSIINLENQGYDKSKYS